jgi:hypothetical protein
MKRKRKSSGISMSEGQLTAVRGLADIRKVLFPEGAPAPRTLKDLKKGIEDYVRAKHSQACAP